MYPGQNFVFKRFNDRNARSCRALLGCCVIGSETYLVLGERNFAPTKRTKYVQVKSRLIHDYMIIITTEFIVSLSLAISRLVWAPLSRRASYIALRAKCDNMPHLALDEIYPRLGRRLLKKWGFKRFNSYVLHLLSTTRWQSLAISV